MKIIRYKLCTTVNCGTEEEPKLENILTDVSISCTTDKLESNLAIAQLEAYNGEYTVEDDGVKEVESPSQLDRIEAQITYTAMMTDTLLEAE